MSERTRLELCGRLGYYPFSAYLQQRFGCKVQKVSIHAGFTCPNRDGTCGSGGCTYCINESFSPQAGKELRPISQQMADGMAYMRRRYKAKKFIAYFQAFTNTYASVTRLKECYDAALDSPEVVGLAIGTRPDCVPEEVLDLLESYSRRVEIWVEYGLQSSHDRTLRRINRGHDFATFVDAVERTRRRAIRRGAHVILGLPGESQTDMMTTACRLQALGLHGVKLHHLYIARGTEMEKQFRTGEVSVLTAESYVKLVCDFLERLSPEVVVQRLVGDTTSRDVLVAPVWPESKATVLRMISEEFGRRGTTQGSRASECAAVTT